MARRLAALLLPGIAIAIACGDPYSSTEVAPVEDSGVDSGPGGDAGGTTDAAADSADGGETCKRLADEHFTASGFPFGWIPEPTGGGTVSVDTSIGLVAPGAIRAAIATSSDLSSARIVRTFNSMPFRTVRVAFAVRVAQGASGYFEPGCDLRFTGDNDGVVSVHPYVGNGTLVVDDNARQNGQEVASGPSVAVTVVDPAHWYLVALELGVLSPATAHAKVAIDSTTFLDRDVPLPLAPTTAEVKCGIDYADPNVTAEVYVDDVTVDLCN